MPVCAAIGATFANDAAISFAFTLPISMAFANRSASFAAIEAS